MYFVLHTVYIGHGKACSVKRQMCVGIGQDLPLPVILPSNSTLFLNSSYSCSYYVKGVLGKVLIQTHSLLLTT